MRMSIKDGPTAMRGPTSMPNGISARLRKSRVFNLCFKIIKLAIRQNLLNYSQYSRANQTAHTSGIISAIQELAKPFQHYRHSWLLPDITNYSAHTATCSFLIYCYVK